MGEPNQETAVVESSNQTDYSAIPIPTKDPTEYSYQERRAELLQQIRDLGHPSLVHQGEMAERYGVSQQQISKDIDKLAEYVADSLGSRHDLDIDSVFSRCIRELIGEGEWWKAARVAEKHADWMTDRADIQELREEIDFLKQVIDAQHDNATTTRKRPERPG